MPTEEPTLNTAPFGHARLMLITHRTSRYTELDEAKMFYEGGGTWLQLRMKEGLKPETAQAIARLSRLDPERVFCVNDNVRIALEAGADGVHLGKQDMPVGEAWMIVRNHAGETPLRHIGATANTFEDIRRAVQEGATYIGLGPYRYTDTKKNLSPVLGLEGYRTILRQCREAGYNLPVYAIGGIGIEDVTALMETGITGIAVSGAIVSAPNPVEETRRFLIEIEKTAPATR